MHLFCAWVLLCVSYPVYPLVVDSPSWLYVHPSVCVPTVAPSIVVLVVSWQTTLEIINVIILLPVCCSCSLPRYILSYSSEQKTIYLSAFVFNSHHHIFLAV